MQRRNIRTPREEEGRRNWEVGTDIYTLLGIKQITNESLHAAQGTLLRALWRPKREGTPKTRGSM